MKAVFRYFLRLKKKKVFFVNYFSFVSRNILFLDLCVSVFNFFLKLVFLIFNKYIFKMENNFGNIVIFVVVKFLNLFFGATQ